MALIYVLAINDNLGLVDEGQVAVEGSVEPEDGLFMNAQASAHITAMCKAIGAFDGLRRAGRRERCRYTLRQLVLWSMHSLRRVTIYFMKRRSHKSGLNLAISGCNPNCFQSSSICSRISGSFRVPYPCIDWLFLPGNLNILQ